MFTGYTLNGKLGIFKTINGKGLLFKGGKLSGHPLRILLGSVHYFLLI